MKKFLITLCVLVSAAVSEGAFAWDQAAMNTQVDQTNFLLDNDCSGTLIDVKERLILTANHCLASHYVDREKTEIKADGTVVTKTVRIMLPGIAAQLQFIDANESARTEYRYKIVATDAATDLGLIQVIGKLPNTVAASFACKAPTRGDIVYAVGNQYAILYSTVTTGIVSSTDRNYPQIGVSDQGDNAMVQHTAAIAPGSSGGALYNSDGQLIGVNVRGGMYTIGLAVTLKDIKTFLASHEPGICK